MKIVINRKSFVDALSIGSQMSGKAKGLSVLENCKLTIKNNTATISSYDSEVAITKRTSIVSSDEDFVVCIEPKALLAILRSIKDENVELSFDNYMCDIIHACGKQTMPYDSDEDFPTPVIDSENKTFNIESNVLFNWLKEAKPFVGTNTLYPSLMGVYIYCGNNECGVASTNMEVLYYNKQFSVHECDEFGATICVKAIDALLPMLNETDNVCVMISERNISFKTDNSMLVAARTESVYPNFRRIIPSDNSVEVSTTKTELVDSVKRAMLMANEQTNLLKFKVGGNAIKITSENTMFSKKSYEECPCSLVGNDIEIGLKGSYALSMLNSIESERIAFSMTSPTKPIIWRDMLNNDKILLQMPCQVI